MPFLSQAQYYSNYTTVSNDPQKVSYMADISLLYAEMSMGKENRDPFFQVGQSMNVQAVVLDKIVPRLAFQQATVFDVVTSSREYGNAATDNILKNPSQFELGAGFMWKLKLKDTRYLIRVKGASDNRTSSTASIQGKKSQRWIGRIGFYHFSQGIVADGNGSLGSVKTSEGIYVKADTLVFDGYNNGATQLSFNGAYVGFNLLTQYNMHITVPGKNKPKAKFRNFRNELYGDLLLGAGKVDPFLFQGQTLPITEGFETRGWGWRFGMKHGVYVSRYINLLTQVEIGRKPGLQTQGLNMLLGTGLMVDF